MGAQSVISHPRIYEEILLNVFSPPSCDSYHVICIRPFKAEPFKGPSHLYYCIREHESSLA